MINLNKDIVKVPITKEMIEKANESLKEGQYNKMSFLKGKGNWGGKLGECMAYNYLNPFLHEKLIWQGTKDYDFLVNKSKIDVKTKHQTVSYMANYFNASVAATSLHQDCDIYIFTRWHQIGTEEGPNSDYGWIIGWITKKDYMEKSTFYRKGEKEGNNKWTVTSDCYNLSYSLLEPIDMLPKCL